MGPDDTVGGVHWSFWVIGGVTLIWNVMGCANFIAQTNPEVLASFSETARALVVGRPAWATAAFAISQFGGALGCLLLLLRKSAASYLFIASLIGVIVTVTHTLRLAGSTIELGAAEITGYILMPLIVAAFLVWYSKLAERKSWIS